MRLSTLETNFRNGVFAGDETILSAFEAGNLTQRKRLDIYRNNVFSNYQSALQAVYSAIFSLVGADYFRQAARRYAEQYSSVSGDIHHYGDDFCDLLTSLPGAEVLAYLPDVARLEWAIHAGFHAADCERLDLSRLQSLATEDYPRLRFLLNPAARLMHSDFPIRRIWEVNLPGYQGDQRVDLGEGGENLLIVRRNFVMEVEAITAADATLLRAIKNNELSGAALDRALTVDADFDFGPFLQRFILNETIVDFLVAPSSALS
jgi:hypothetical protein